MRIIFPRLQVCESFSITSLCVKLTSKMSLRHFAVSASLYFFYCKVKSIWYQLLCVAFKRANIRVFLTKKESALKFVCFGLCFSVPGDHQSKMHQNISQDTSCYSENGENYRGNVNVTISRKLCAYWAKHTYLNKMVYPELQRNYCRNPQGYGSRPWCYTDLQTRTWEYCKVNKCKGIVVLGRFQKEPFISIPKINISFREFALVCSSKNQKILSITFLYINLDYIYKGKVLFDLFTKTSTDLGKGTCNILISQTSFSKVNFSHSQCFHC